MKSKILLFIVVFSFSSIGQTNNNLGLIEAIKTKEVKNLIEKNLNGCWLVKKKTDSNGKEIDISGYETNYCFLNDSICYIGMNIENRKVSGKYFYNDERKELVINYVNPVIPGKGSVPDKLLDSLIKKQIIKPIKFVVIEINKINSNELVIIEHLPHDEKSFYYNLIYYRKK